MEPEQQVARIALAPSFLRLLRLLAEIAPERRETAIRKIMDAAKELDGLTARDRNFLMKAVPTADQGVLLHMARNIEKALVKE
jgi:hypothetical protein